MSTRKSKRKSIEMNEKNDTSYNQLSSNNTKRRDNAIFKLENTPSANSIYDLIEISKTLNFYKNIDTIMLWKITPYLEQLDKMIGMQSLKETIFCQIIYYLQGMHAHNKNEEYLHTMIFGEPGCGKTTVARIIGKMYQAMGVLSQSGPFVVAYRDDFIAGYLGQTAIKTRKLLESCIGGVLFVDEVYSLCPRSGDKDIFSDETIETITAFLSEHKNDFCFIGAGYADDIINRFFAKNKGLERRFQWINIIDKYTVDDLADIMLKMVSDMKWKTSLDKKDICSILKNDIKLFNNGGDIEIFISKCKMIHAKRVFTLDKDHKFILTKKDLEDTFTLFKKSRLKTASKPDPPYGMYT